MSGPEQEPLDRAAALIREGCLTEALAILHPICREQPDNVQAWWLAAQAVDNPEEMRRALQQVLRIDPYHSQAAERLQQVRSTSAIPRPTASALRTIAHPGDDQSLDELAVSRDIVYLVADDGELATPLPAKQARFKKKKRPVVHVPVWVLLVSPALLIVLALLLISRRSAATPVSNPPTDRVGPYYPRLMDEDTYLTYCDHCYAHSPSPQICGKSQTIVGRVEQKTGVAVRVWTATGSVDTSVLTTGDRGDYRLLFSSDDLTPADYSPDTSVSARVRLYDAQGVPLSGITDIRFDRDQCTAFLVFRLKPIVGAIIPRPPISPWPGPYRLSYSTPTGAGFLSGSNPLWKTYRDCGWAGFIGIAYDDYGAVDGLTVQAWELGQSSTIYTARTGDHPEIGGGGWVLPLQSGSQYVFNVLNHQGLSRGTQLIDFPAGDCQSRIVRAAITQNGP